jgi:acyl-CoA synthetase (AMP-forming)/AMP-acid ligase II
MSTSIASRISDTARTVRALAAARILSLRRPDRLLRMGVAVRRAGMTATAGFAAAAATCPNRPGVIDDKGILTWRELHQRSDALAAALQNTLRTLPQTEPQTAHTSKTIALLCRNHRGFIEAMIAADRCGADALLLNTSFAAPAMADVIQREHVDAVVYDDEFSDIVSAALRSAPQVHKIRAWTDPGSGHGVTVEDLIAIHRGKRPQRPSRQGMTILLTSGTTGTPKGARRTARGGAHELTGILETIPWRAEETTVIVAPMFHAWGYAQLLFSAWMACTIVTTRKFGAEATLRMIESTRASGLCAVPVMLERIVDLPTDVVNRYHTESLRFAAISGSRMQPRAVTAFMDRFGDVIYNHYNATEAGMIAIATPTDLRAAPDTAGTAAAGSELRILDETDQPLGPGQIGQIFTRSSTHFDGYTTGAEKRFHDGFMATGDLGYLDEAGRLFVVGRDDEMIVSGGENVYPIEVENRLLAHPAIAEVAVIGVDDDHYGQRLLAYAVLRTGESPSPEALKQYVRDGLASFKVPREILIVDHLPRTGTGKVARSALKAQTGEAER